MRALFVYLFIMAADEKEFACLSGAKLINNYVPGTSPENAK